MLGLPDTVAACLFDLDGVITKTATVHAAAWSRTFDEVLAAWSRATGNVGARFDPVADYAAYVDGKRRSDGVRDFLASRGIHLPEGSPQDDPGACTVAGVGNRKNALLREVIRRDGVEVYPGSVDYLRAVRGAGLPTAVVSSSANTALVLEETNLGGLFDVRVDGVVARDRRLPGKPAPDTFVYAARRLGSSPAHGAVFEDSLAGVAAGRAGGFGVVVGVDRLGQRDELLAHGADRVVADLAEMREPV